MRIRTLCSALCLLFAGCAQNYPQNAQEFRQAVPGAFMAKQQSFETKRSLREVARTFEARAPQCLNVAVRTVSQTATSYQNILTTYKATVVSTAQKAELHIQRTHKGGGVITPGKVPPGGLYMLVADATPLDNARTRIDIYGPSIGADPIVRAITGWATGDNLGCPDLTKTS